MHWQKDACGWRWITSISICWLHPTKPCRHRQIMSLHSSSSWGPEVWSPLWRFAGPDLHVELYIIDKIQLKLKPTQPQWWLMMMVKYYKLSQYECNREWRVSHHLLKRFSMKPLTLADVYIIGHSFICRQALWPVRQIHWPLIASVWIHFHEKY